MWGFPTLGPDIQPMKQIILNEQTKCSKVGKSSMCFINRKKFIKLKKVQFSELGTGYITDKANCFIQADKMLHITHSLMLTQNTKFLKNFSWQFHFTFRVC